jgi:hypothetical protein
MSRLDVLPGITGLAQINLPPDRDLDDVRRKIVLDREYIESATFLFDIRIFLCTLLRVVGVRGELAMRLMGLQRNVVLPPATSPTSLEDTVHDIPTTKTVSIVTTCETRRDENGHNSSIAPFAAVDVR